MASHEGLVGVQATWNGWRSAEVAVAALRDLHWFQPAGAPSPLLHAYVDCSEIVVGSLPHQCDPASAPHRLRVCLLKSHTVARIYAQLAARAAQVVALQAHMPAAAR